MLEHLERNYMGLSVPQPGDSKFFGLYLSPSRSALHSNLCRAIKKNPVSNTQSFNFLVAKTEIISFYVKQATLPHSLCTIRGIGYLNFSLYFSCALSTSACLFPFFPFYRNFFPTNLYKCKSRNSIYTTTYHTKRMFNSSILRSHTSLSRLRAF